MAARDGLYGGLRRDFCLHEEFREENLEAGIRDEALAYFEDRGIKWHDGKGNAPSNHLCCSQSCCVNFWFPYIRAPDRLGDVLRGLGYDVDKVLEITSDQELRDGTVPYVAFEWIGERNYLGELTRGNVARDGERTRGANFTSMDFCLRFRRSDGRIQIVVGEWKYTESYDSGEDLRYSPSGTDRLNSIYRKNLVRPECQIVEDVNFEVLFFDPFDQLMRQQLLCSAMERNREMNADKVTLLHIAPKANRELMKRITSKELNVVGSDIHDIWNSLTRPGHFKGVATEDLLRLVRSTAPTVQTAEYLKLRYGGMA